MSAASLPAPASDTIVALATAAARAALGVIRLSGPQAVAIAGRIVRLRQGVPLHAAADRVAHAMSVVDPVTGEALDDALVTVMRAPRSYTGEDCVELSCHGGPALLATVLDLLVAAGARLAEAGEFTRRAFLNGRLDLTQAEAVAALIQARSERAVRAGARALRGGFADALRPVREGLLDLVAGLEVGLDFPDDGLGLSTADALKALGEIARALERLSARGRAGSVLQEGLTVALAGAPNVGKSSLLNALVEQDRAIVSAVAGTTRDLVDAGLDVSGVPVRLLDGAGLGMPADALDAESMRRMRGAIEEADLVLVVLDASREPGPDDGGVLSLTGARERIVVLNKIDVGADGRRGVSVDCRCSALTGEGIDTLRERLAAWVAGRIQDDGEEGGLAASLRVRQDLEGARAAIERASEGLGGGLPVEAALVDLREALTTTGRVLGLEADDAVLDRIFSTFCVGK